MLTTAALMAAATLLQPIASHAVQLSTELSASVHAWFASAYEWIYPSTHACLHCFFFCGAARRVKPLGVDPLCHAAEEETSSTQTHQVMCL